MVKIDVSGVQLHQTRCNFTGSKSEKFGYGWPLTEKKEDNLSGMKL